ncbi:DUF1295 domain-containing protein [Candidatus Nomurabacteria bacterium]|nr:DUF1295 domain-containing protein [Candidatus Nomurabacteria bacterium]
MIKLILIVGLIVNYVPKFRLSVFKQLKSLRKISLILFEIIIPLVAIIQLYLLNPKNNFITYMGIIIFSIGIVLGTIARLQLRENYLPILATSPSSRIITNGIYAYIRHPIYFGTILTIMGFELVLFPFLSLMILIIIPILVWQINKEEKLLFKHLKKEWEIYILRTPFKLIPFVY